jgi:peptidoglycan/LPS O-acetylase OafA/YrhL
MTLGDRLAATGNRPTGFDYMRIVLAVLILCWHSVITSYGQAAQNAFGAGPAHPFAAMLLPMFFGLSGFLVAGSLERSRTIAMFAALRVIRLFPALAVESLVSALVLGPLLTRLPLTEYVSDPVFHRYFLNLLGHPQYLLPGVFETNPFGRVNAQLWTIPWELNCYVAISGLALCGVVARRRLMIPAIVLLTLAALGVSLVRHPGQAAATAGSLPGPLLVVSFLCGVALYLYRDRLPWRRDWGLATLIAALGLLCVPYGQYLAVLPAAYATVWLGLENPRKLAVLKGADYSYGVFLYSFAIQQTIVALAPWARHWWINIALALPAAIAVAALSWTLVEKPALRLRAPLQRLEAWWLSRRPRGARLPLGAAKEPLR